VAKAAVVAAIVVCGLFAPKPAAAYSVLAHEANIDAVAASGGCLAAAVVAVVGDIGVMTGPQKESIEHSTELARP
jgi:H+/gluconate symporter-like permease